MASDGKVLLCVVAVVGVAGLLYYAQQQTGETGAPIPEAQAEWQMMGLGIQGDASLNSGTPLDTAFHIHGWFPGYDPEPSTVPVVDSRVRYPAVPGGNISTVMHNGWSQACKAAPAGNDWRLNPPEAAVL